MAFCRNCGASFDGNFCPNCGEKAKKFCPNCGAETENESKFCSNCGTVLTNGSAAYVNKSRDTFNNRPVEEIRARTEEENRLAENGARSLRASERIENAEHTEIPPRTAAPMETSETYPSVFKGGALSRAFRLFAVGFVTLITLGLAYPAMFCWFLRWQSSKTYINGRKLVFDGTGGQLFGKYILWCVLSLITLGLYYIFAARVNMIAWQTKHTHFEGVEPCGDEDKKSKFTGNSLQLLGVNLLTCFVTVITLSLGLYWAYCYKQRWFAKHKIIDGHSLYFDGRAGQYFGKCLLWGFLSLITFGIYSFWMAVNILKWKTKHTKLSEPNNLPYLGVEKKPNNSAGAYPKYAAPGNTAANQASPNKNQSNNLPIIGFVLSILPSFSFVGFIVSIVALAKCNDFNGKNKGFAIAGIIIPIVYFVLGFIFGAVLLPILNNIYLCCAI